MGKEPTITIPLRLVFWADAPPDAMREVAAIIADKLRAEAERHVAELNAEGRHQIKGVLARRRESDR